jgi:hypothetical protein
MSAPEPNVSARELEGLTQTAADPQTANPTTLLTNKLTPPYEIIKLPGEGNLWVSFSYEGTPAAHAWLMHPSLESVEIKPKTPEVLASRKGDMLLCKIGFAGQQIELSWRYE